MLATALPPNPQQYHTYAWYLARRYEFVDPLLGPDDVYQVAMIALLDLWRTKPHAPEAYCIKVMNNAVKAEIKRLLQTRLPGEQVPIEEAYEAAGPLDTLQLTLDKEDTERIGKAMAQLPDAEFQMIALRLMGYHPIPLMSGPGWTKKRAAEVYHNARMHLKRLLEESEGRT